MLPPTTLEGNAATFSYQSELAAITAVIDQMWQCDAKLKMPTPSMMTPPSKNPLLPPAPSADTTTMDNVMLTATLLLTMTLTVTQITPDSAIVIVQDTNDRTHPHDKQCQSSSSITVMFLVQVQMLHTINMLLVELDRLVDKLIDDLTCFDTCPLPSSPYNLLKLTPYPTICLTTAIQPPDCFPKPQIPLWLPYNAESGTPLAPAPKISPYKRHIPAKPPFPHGHSGNRATAMPQTKDCMHPP